jgi:hypothetical protein
MLADRRSRILSSEPVLGNRLVFDALANMPPGYDVDNVLSFNAAVPANALTIGRGAYGAMPDRAIKDTLFVLEDHDDDVLGYYELQNLIEGLALVRPESLGRWGPWPHPYSSRIVRVDLASYPGWEGKSASGNTRHSFVYDEVKAAAFYEQFFRSKLSRYTIC